MSFFTLINYKTENNFLILNLKLDFPMDIPK